MFRGIYESASDTDQADRQAIQEKSWLHFVALALAVVMIVPYVSVFRIDYGDAEKFQWSDVVLSDVIPEPNPLFGEVVSNGDTYLSLYIYKIDQSDYDTYVAACKAQGFTIDADEGDRSYYAYNAAGYKLSLYFYLGSINAIKNNLLSLKLAHGYHKP